MENINLLETSLTTCSRCKNPLCRGTDIYDCCDVLEPNWIQNYVKNMYLSNKRKPKYESEYAKWENQINK